MTNGFRYALAAMLAALLACRAPKPSSGEQRYDALHDVDRLSFELPTRWRSAEMAAAYGALFAGPSAAEVAELETRDLQSRFRAASLVGYYADDPAFVDAMARIHGELERRGVATNTEHKKLFEGYVHVRMLAEARAVARQHPGLDVEELPDVVELETRVAGEATAWTIAPDQRALQRERIDLDQPAQVVMVVHPDCHFSANAMRALESDPSLGPVLAAHAVRLAPQASKIDFDILQQWNREHPGQAIALTVRSDEWPLVDTWGTPSFYFLQHGKLVARLIGWPDGGRKSQVIAGLQQIGLLPVR